MRRMLANVWLMTFGVPCVLVLLAATVDPFTLALPVGGPVGHPGLWLTHMAVHANVGHLLTNLTSALFVYVCEVVNGTLRTAAVALVAGFTAALWTRALVAKPALYLGYSGCAYGVIGCVIACVWINLDSLRRPRTWLAATATYIGAELLLARWLDDWFDGSLQVAHGAHGAGGLQGAALGVLFGQNISLRACERTLRTLAATVSVVAIAVPIVLARR